MMYLKVVVGFVVLLITAEILVRGAVFLADRMGISKLVIGMTVVAMGTSAPELVVSLDAAKAGASFIPSPTTTTVILLALILRMFC